MQATSGTTTATTAPAAQPAVAPMTYDQAQILISQLAASFPPPSATQAQAQNIPATPGYRPMVPRQFNTTPNQGGQSGGANYQGRFYDPYHAERKRLAAIHGQDEANRMIQEMGGSYLPPAVAAIQSGEFIPRGRGLARGQGGRVQSADNSGRRPYRGGTRNASEDGRGAYSSARNAQNQSQGESAGTGGAKKNRNLFKIKGTDITINLADFPNEKTGKPMSRKVANAIVNKMLDNDIDLTVKNFKMSVDKKKKSGNTASDKKKDDDKDSGPKNFNGELHPVALDIPEKSLKLKDFDNSRQIVTQVANIDDGIACGYTVITKQKPPLFALNSSHVAAASEDALLKQQDKAKQKKDEMKPYRGYYRPLQSMVANDLISDNVARIKTITDLPEPLADLHERAIKELISQPTVRHVTNIKAEPILVKPSVDSDFVLGTAIDITLRFHTKGVMKDVTYGKGSATYVPKDTCDLDQPILGENLTKLNFKQGVKTQVPTELVFNNFLNKKRKKVKPAPTVSASSTTAADKPVFHAGDTAGAVGGDDTMSSWINGNDSDNFWGNKTVNQQGNIINKSELLKQLEKTAEKTRAIANELGITRSVEEKEAFREMLLRVPVVTTIIEDKISDAELRDKWLDKLGEIVRYVRTLSGHDRRSKIQKTLEEKLMNVANLGDESSGYLTQLLNVLEIVNQKAMPM